jgi:hypothetical protein
VGICRPSASARVLHAGAPCEPLSAFCRHNSSVQISQAAGYWLAPFHCFVRHMVSDTGSRRVTCKTSLRQFGAASYSATHATVAS